MNMCQEGLDEEEFDGSQHFQVNIVILEARHLAMANSDSKVTVSIGNRRKTLRSKTVKTDAPYFNELCIFNFYSPLSVLLDEILKIKIYGVTKLRRSRLIGSFSVELATIWAQPNHQFYHKWAALTDPKNPAAGVKGYLKCDIGVLTRGTKSRPVDHDPAENIEDHLLVPYGEVNDRQKAKFVFSVFRADGFSNNSSNQPLHSLYAYVRITYAGVTGRTRVASKTFNPSWNEELSFVDMIPALCRYVHIEICDAYKTTSRGILGVANLDLRRLSHEGEDGFLPTYGPAFLYLYQNFAKFDTHNKCCFFSSSFTYTCRLLMALRTEVVDYPEDVSAKNANMLTVKPKNIPSLDESKYFEYEEFIFFAAVFDILLFDASIVTSTLSIRVNIGPSKPFESGITLKPSVEIKPALKAKTNINEDDHDEKVSLKSKKTVTFENEEFSSRTSSEILNEVVPGEKDEKPNMPESPDPSKEEMQPKISENRSKRSRFREWKPLNDFKRWPEIWSSKKKPSESYQPNKSKNWKILNSTREWKPLKQIQDWPTDWRQRRKGGITPGPKVKTSSEEEQKPRKRIKLGRTQRDWRPTKSWTLTLKGIKRKKFVPEADKKDSDTESDSSAVNKDNSTSIANESEDYAYADSENSGSPQMGEVPKVIQAKAFGKGLNDQKIRSKATFYFAESLVLPEPFKSLRTWPTEWRTGTLKRKAQIDEKQKIFVSGNDRKGRKRRRLKEWINESVTKSRAVPSKEWAYWKKVQVVAAELKEKTRKYSGKQSSADSGERDRLQGKSWRKDATADERGLRWKGSVKNWKMAKILGEWTAEWKERRGKRKSNSTGSQESTTATNTDWINLKNRIFRERRKRESESSSTEQISSSTETQESGYPRRRKLRRRMKQLRPKNAHKFDIPSQGSGKKFGSERRMKNTWKARAKRKRENREASSSEANQIFDRTEKEKFGKIKKVVISLKEWPTEWRRVPFGERIAPDAHRRRSQGGELEERTKKDSQDHREEESFEESEVLNHRTGPEQNIKHSLSVLPAQTESSRSIPTNEETPVPKYASEDSISLDNDFILNRLKRTDSEETNWSQKAVWSQEETENEREASRHSLVEETEKGQKKLGNNNKSDKEKRSKENSEKTGGTFHPDFEPKSKEISFRPKGKEKDDRQGYKKSPSKESSSLDESDTSTKTEEIPCKRLYKKWKTSKRAPVNSSEESGAASGSEDGESSEGYDSDSESYGSNSSSSSSEGDDTSSESKDRRKCIFKKKSTDVNSQCNECFREALDSARSKKRYWYTKNKRVTSASLFSPKNTTETNIKVYFTFKNNLLRLGNVHRGQEDVRDVRVDRDKEATSGELNKKENKLDKGKKRWKFWRTKRKKPEIPKEPGSEEEVEDGKRKEEDLANDENAEKEEGASNTSEGGGSLLSSDEKVHPDQGDELPVENAEGKSESIQPGDAEPGNITRGEKKEGSSSEEEQVVIKKEEEEEEEVEKTKGEEDKYREPLRRKRKFWHVKTGKKGAENDREREESSSDDDTAPPGKDEPKNRQKQGGGNERVTSHIKQKKGRFWPRKRATPQEPKRALKFPREEDDIEGKESELETANEMKHARIYNGCSATAPQPVAIREHYGFTNNSGNYPCLHINGEWPNALRRTYRSNIIQKSIKNLKSGINDVENELSSDNKIEASEKLKKIFQDLSEDCKKILSLTTRVESNDTNLYRERRRYYHREIREMIVKAETVSKKNVVIAEDELKKANSYLSTLQRYAQDPEDSFPDTEIWLIKDGKTVAQHRMRTQKIAFSPDVEERGVRSGKIQSIIVRGREGKEVAKLEIFMWFGLGKHFAECRNMLPPGFQHEPHRCRGTAVPDLPILLSYEEVHYFECRVHLSQARILLGADTNGLADPFVRVIVLGQLKDSQIQKETLNPTWDETLVFSNLTLYGPVEYIKDNSITITVEVIDYDYLSKNELIGRTLLKPVVMLNYEEYKPPKLIWEGIRKECNETGKILLTAELLEVSDRGLEQLEDRGTTIPIPKDIRPHSVGHRLEVLFWGIRELKKKSPGATKVFVTMECGGKYLSSPVLKHTKKGLNFPGTVQTLDLELPEDHNYKPPFILKLFQTNSLVPGYEIYAGNCIVPSVKVFFCTAVDDQEKKKRERAFIQLLAESNRAKKAEDNETLAREKAKERGLRWKRLRLKLADILEDIAVVLLKPYKRLKCKIRRSCVDVETGHLLEYEHDETLDWWVKYYASKEHKTDIADSETLVIYEEELEAQPQFHGFSDFIYTFNMVTGKVKKNVESQIAVGKVKAAVKLYRWPLEEGSHHTLYGVDIKKGILKQLPSNAAVRFVARIYVVCCKNLTPKDLYGKSDPYLILQMGKQRINDEQNYIPKQVNPVFGRCFEFKGVFPKEHLLRIKVMDHDILTKDDLIGETFIDLESRYYTKHHASCGLPKTYSKTGYNAWRDAFKPTEILKTVCKQSNVEQPVYTNNGVRIGEYEFKAAAVNEKYGDEMNALAALKKWHEIPLHGYHLVPEHVETRALYHPSFPGVEQGKIEMWIDVFPADFRYIPPIVDINPRKPVTMELRAIVWNVEGVILDDTTLFFNEKMSDIYVQGWLNALEEDKQATDVHYRSMNGEGNFNWRFIFPFKYIAAERRLVVYKSQNVLDTEPEEMKFPCRLELQVWDNDFFSDDFLGSLNLELCSMPRGAKISTRCKLSMFEETTPKINLFKIRRTRGWWPFRRIIDAESSEYSLTGKIDLELEVMTENEARENPVGKGREEPKALPEPKRPESSFIWFFNPLKTCRYIICRKYGKYLLLIIGIVMVVAFVLIGIYAFPGYAVKRILGA